MVKNMRKWRIVYGCRGKVKSDINTLSHFSKSKIDKPIIAYPHHNINDNSRSAIRLPTLNIKKLSGDLLEW